MHGRWSKEQTSISDAPIRFTRGFMQQYNHRHIVLIWIKYNLYHFHLRDVKFGLEFRRFHLFLIFQENMQAIDLCSIYNIFHSIKLETKIYESWRYELLDFQKNRKMGKVPKTHFHFCNTLSPSCGHKDLFYDNYNQEGSCRFDMNMIESPPLVTWWSYWAVMTEVAKLIFMHFQSIAQPRDKWGWLHHLHIEATCLFLL